MGQAKRRGTFEQRKKEGEAKRQLAEDEKQARLAEIRERRLSTPRGREMAAWYAASLGITSNH